MISHTNSRLKILFVSRHDYRTKKKASSHFLAHEFARVGHDVRFISIGISPLSRLRSDSRIGLLNKANSWDSVDGINCYLWKTIVHPIDVGGGPLRKIAGYAYDIWAHWPCADFDKSARWADLIIVESGIGPVLLRRLRKNAATARICYYASDLLAAAKVHPRVQEILERDQKTVDIVMTVSRSMLPHFARFSAPCVFLPHGLDVKAYAKKHPTPYVTSKNVVSVGSALFDRQAVDIAAKHFPDYEFHLIGCRAEGAFPSNVRVYNELPFEETIPYLQHASVGMAAYTDGVPDKAYIIDSSMKLMQFEHLGLPAVCPSFAAGDRPLRFGYIQGDVDSIVAAFSKATNPSLERIPVPAKDWQEVARDFIALAFDK